jgi:cell division protein FtsB
VPFPFQGPKLSFVLRARKKSSTPLPATGLWVIIGLAAVFFLVRYGTELLREHDLREQARRQDAANRALSDTNARLRSALLYYGSDRYIEQRAREDLNLRRPDESVIIPITAPEAMGSTEEAQPDATQDAPLAEVPAQRSEQPNWKRWLDMFAPAP